jgi:hypothetical protein
MEVFESSISDADAKNYVKEVMVEIQKAEKENHLLYQTENYYYLNYLS